MFSVSEKSQVERLKNILEKSKVLVNGKIQNEPKWIKDSLPNLKSKNELKNEGILSDSLHNEVHSIVEYLDSHHGFSSIREWYKQDIDSIVNLKKPKNSNYYNYSEAEIYMKTMGFNSNRIYTENKSNSVSYNSNYDYKITKISGYDYLINFEKYEYDNKDKNISNFTIDNIEYKMEYSDKPSLEIVLKSKNEIVNFGLDSLLEKLEKEYGNDTNSAIPLSKMTLIKSTTKFDIKMEIHSLVIETKNNRLIINNIKGAVFVNSKE